MKPTDMLNREDGNFMNTFYRKANGENKTYPKAVIEFLDKDDPKVDVVYLYLDDVRNIDYETANKFKTCVFCTSVNQAKEFVLKWMNRGVTRFYFDLDHDLGDYAVDGGDAINLVNWLIEYYNDKNLDFKFHFHSMNPVGVQNMRNAVEKYWEVL